MKIEELAEISKIFCNEHALKIIALLAKKSMNGTEIGEATDSSQSYAASITMGRLAGIGLIFWRDLPTPKWELNREAYAAFIAELSALGQGIVT